MTRRRIVLPIILALAVATTPVLAGCSAQTIVNKATDGNVDIGGKKVPSDFPSAVPLAKGDVEYGAGIGKGAKKIWNVTIKVEGAAAYDTISAELVAAGYASATQVSQATDTGGTGVFADATYSIVLVVAKNGSKGWIANYTVSPAADK